MRATTLLILAVVLLSFVGCGSTSTDVPDHVPTATSQADEVPEPMPIDWRSCEATRSFRQTTIVCAKDEISFSFADVVAMGAENKKLHDAMIVQTVNNLKADPGRRLVAVEEIEIDAKASTVAIEAAEQSGTSYYTVLVGGVGPETLRVIICTDITDVGVFRCAEETRVFFTKGLPGELSIKDETPPVTFGDQTLSLPEGCVANAAESIVCGNESLVWFAEEAPNSHVQEIASLRTMVERGANAETPPVVTEYKCKLGGNETDCRQHHYKLGGGRFIKTITGVTKAAGKNYAAYCQWDQRSASGENAPKSCELLFK